VHFLDGVSDQISAITRGRLPNWVVELTHLFFSPNCLRLSFLGMNGGSVGGVFRVLIVDEASEVRDALTEAGCAEIETASHADAPVRVQAQRPDLVLFELAGSNIPTLQRLVRVDRELPILVLCEDRHVESALRAGAFECVTTPVRQRELVGRLRHVVRTGKDTRRRVTRDRKISDALIALKREKEDLERLVCVDALTGIANRRHALALLEAEWRRSSREHQPLGLVMIDLDCYHAYNEQYGHLGGDACLQKVCEAMVKCLRRPSDYLGRYGGEEFMAVLPNTDAVGAKLVAERLRAAVEELQIPHAASMCGRVVTITAGFASLHVTSDLTMDKLIAAADGALLRAKAAGRNRVGGDAPLVRPSRQSPQSWLRWDPVIADPWFVERIPGFLTEAHAGARAIVQYLRDDDMLGIERTAAALRAAAGSLGLGVVEKLVGELERAGRSCDVTTAREAADELIQYVTHVQVVYRRPTEETASAS
jgi:diguanylate cyclase (GGDEF)-like protein